VLVSSNLNRNIAIEAKRLGFAGILAKPLSPKILSERLTMIVANTARTNDKAAAEAPASL
jgi:AmiR/NasT family two-component response regulator